jgi:uncharacterized protein CbrC (UPF0167 family)
LYPQNGDGVVSGVDWAKMALEQQERYLRACEDMKQLRGDRDAMQAQIEELASQVASLTAERDALEKWKRGADDTLLAAACGEAKLRARLVVAVEALEKVHHTLEQSLSGSPQEELQETWEKFSHNLCAFTAASDTAESNRLLPIVREALEKVRSET